ncbi:MAG: DUF6941 family protein [Spirochaetia bacterium]
MEAVCHALLFADKIITEKNGKKGLIGVFSRFSFPQFPATVPMWFIYADVANITGKHKFSISLVDESSQKNILPIDGDINIPETGRNLEIIIPVSRAAFQNPGNYVLSLKINGTEVAARTLYVTKAEQGPSIN